MISTKRATANGKNFLNILFRNAEHGRSHLAGRESVVGRRLDMNEKHYLTIFVGLLIFICHFLFTVFGDRGLVDLSNKRAVRDLLRIENRRVYYQNLQLRRIIIRLRDDDDYIEWVARAELKMVRKGEIILVKP